jgi:hypothetical protein
MKEIKIEISAPVVPSQKMADKIGMQIKTMLENDDVDIRFYESGKDVYGLNQFDIIAIDQDKHELIEVRNAVMTLLFNTFFGNKK